MPREERGAGQVGFSAKDYKVCDLCGALNRVNNNECFVCGWNGMFHREEDMVMQAMREFEAHYGGLSETIMSEELLSDQPQRSGFISTLIDRIKHIFSGREAA